MMPTSQYVEVRNNSYYIAGTRIGLDVLIQEYREGRSAEEIFDAYPSIGLLSRVYGSIAFVLDHPQEIDSYLKAQDDRWKAFQASNPLPPDMVERFERARRGPSVRRS